MAVDPGGGIGVSGVVLWLLLEDGEYERGIELTLRNRRRTWEEDCLS